MKLKSIKWDREGSIYIARIDEICVGLMHLAPHGHYSLNYHFGIETIYTDDIDAAQIRAEEIISTMIFSLIVGA